MTTKQHLRHIITDNETVQVEYNCDLNTLRERQRNILCLTDIVMTKHETVYGFSVLSIFLCQFIFFFLSYSIQCRNIKLNVFENGWC